MRHLKAGKRLGVTTSHRKAVMRNLVTSLLENGEIKTTITRAKEMRKYLDKMIGFGKRGTLHSRRQALAFIKSDEAVEKLFSEYGQLYQDRMGGYTRIYKLGNRLGDNAQMAIIQLVGLDTTGKEATEVKDEPIEEIKEELVKEIEDKSKQEADDKMESKSSGEPVDEAKSEQVTSDTDKSGDEKTNSSDGDQQPDMAEGGVVKKSTSENDQAVADESSPSPKDAQTEVKND